MPISIYSARDKSVKLTVWGANPNVVSAVKSASKRKTVIGVARVSVADTIPEESVTVRDTVYIPAVS